MNRTIISAVAALAWLSTAAPSIAAEVELLLASSDKAILLVDGNRRVLGVGDTSPEGVTLVAIGDSTVSVQQADEVTTLGLSRTLSGHAIVGPGGDNAPAPGPKEHRIYADATGMFQTTGSINGFPVGFLVDTGATTVVVNGREARRLGLDHRMQGEIVPVITASGVERGFQVKLRSVKVGPIELTGVEAIVVDGDFPTPALLGMSFLGRLESDRTPTMLRLRKKY